MKHRKNRFLLDVMKTLSISFLFFALILSGCKKDPDVVKGFYESMHFIRQGGGQIDFNLYPTDNSDQLKVVVSEYSFRDTTIQIFIDNSDDNASVFSTLNKAMNNQLQINGDFQQSALATGTWSYIYFAANNIETEVTNTELRNSLLKFEQLVKDKIQ